MTKKSLFIPTQYFIGYVCHTVGDHFTVGAAAAFLSHLKCFEKRRVNCSSKAVDKVSEACNRAFKLSKAYNFLFVAFFFLS